MSPENSTPPDGGEQDRPLRLRCRRTGKTYIMEGDEPCPFCGAAIHGLDLSRLNAEIARLSEPLPGSTQEAGS